MRLTLRTLLAYRDGVLSPVDSEDLHRRVQQSEDAGNLLKRITSVTTKMQAASPTIVGKGLGADPNSVAEYLDDALVSDKVPELERICLESDVQLAELAHCHFLLSSAMQTSVKVSNRLRSLAVEIGSHQRREEIKHELISRLHLEPGNEGARMVRADNAHAMPSSRLHQPNSVQHEEHEVKVPAPMVASGGGTIKQQGLNLEGSKLSHEVPEYLVGANRGNWRVPLAIGGLVAVLGMLVWQTLGPWDRVLALFESPANAPAARAAPVPEDLAGAVSTKGDAPTTEAPKPATAEFKTEVTDVPLPAAGNQPSDAPPKIEAAGKLPAKDVIQNAVPQTVAIEPTTPSQSVAAGVGQAQWLPQDDVEKSVVLLTQIAGNLQRAMVGDTIPPGTEIIVPPQMRTTIDLPGGVLWTTCGASRMTIANPEIADVNINIARGLLRGGPSGKVLRVACPVDDYRIELGGAGSRASLEVGYRPMAHASVLDASLYRPCLILIAAEGTVTFAETRNPAQPPIELVLGEGVAVMQGSRPQRFKLQNIPAWYRSGASRPIDAEAAKDLSKLLVAPPGDQAVAALLDQLTQNRRPETAALAVQTDLLLGRWEAFSAGFLSNDRMSSHWSPTIDLARQLLAANSEQAKTVRALFNRGGAQGNQLFEMLCGMPEDQLATDGLTRLVDTLDDDDLPSRVVASYQLSLVTGKVLGYQPQEPNRASVQSWRRELVTNRLSVLPVQDWIWERISR